VIDQNPMETARRLFRRQEQHRCLICGRQAREQHHIAGKAHDRQFTSPLCQAHHDIATEDLRRAGVDMRKTSSSVERVRRALQATSIFLSMLAEAHGVGLSLYRSSKRCLTVCAAHHNKPDQAGERDLHDYTDCNARKSSLRQSRSIAKGF